MKRLLCCGLMLCLLLSGCARSAPEKTADGTDWDENWINLGGVLGVSEPGHDLVLRDNNEALSVADMYLASWTVGEGSPYTNEDGDEVVLYPARLDVLVYGRRDETAARQVLEDWNARQRETYDVAGTQEENYGDYTVSTYTCKSESNPYSRGASAFLVHKNYAISVELNCQEDFAGDETEILQAFLDSCHFAA